MDLFQVEMLPPLKSVSRVEGQSLEEQFAAFHAANPQVYGALRSLALSMRRRGVRKAGIGQLFEVLRWQYALQTKGADFKLNNNFRSFYARLLDNEPELHGLFELRMQRWQQHHR
jgi:hypothetical protein